MAEAAEMDVSVMAVMAYLVNPLRAETKEDMEQAEEELLGITLLELEEAAQEEMES